METSTTQEKTNFQEKIAKGLTEVIEGCLEGAKDFINDLKPLNRRNPQVEVCIRDLLNNAEVYLKQAKQNSYFTEIDNIQLTNRYEVIKKDFDKLKF